MEKTERYLQIMKRIDVVFTPTSDERERISQRLSKMDEKELENLYHNFELMGIDKVLECMMGV